jgi:hypothetical protein
MSVPIIPGPVPAGRPAAGRALSVPWPVLVRGWALVRG